MTAAVDINKGKGVARHRQRAGGAQHPMPNGRDDRSAKHLIRIVVRCCGNVGRGRCLSVQ